MRGALKLDGWYDEGPGGEHPHVFSHRSKPGKIPIKGSWSGLRAGCPILKGIARTMGISDKRLLQLLNQAR